MKKIITERIFEEAEYFCDKHLTRRCYSNLKTTSGYGSEYDLTGIELHLCDECLKEVYNYLNRKFTVKPKDISMV